MGKSIQQKDRRSIQLLPVIGGVITMLVMTLYGCDKIMYEKINTIEVCKSMIGLWGTLLGFIITAVSILVTLDTGKGIIKILKESNHFNTVLYAFLITAVFLLIGIIYATIIVYLNISGHLVHGITGGMIITEFISLSLSIYFMFWILIRNE